VKSISQIVGDTWLQVLRETPFDSDFESLNVLLGRPNMPYRDRLTRRRRNAAGHLIPQSTIVRNNLRRLGKPKRKPVIT
jgi:hypothetical protein